MAAAAPVSASASAAAASAATPEFAQIDLGVHFAWDGVSGVWTVRQEKRGCLVQLVDAGSERALGLGGAALKELVRHQVYPRSDGLQNVWLREPTVIRGEDHRVFSTHGWAPVRVQLTPVWATARLERYEEVRVREEFRNELPAEMEVRPRKVYPQGASHTSAVWSPDCPEPREGFTVNIASSVQGPGGFEHVWKFVSEVGRTVGSHNSSRSSENNNNKNNDSQHNPSQNNNSNSKSKNDNSNNSDNNNQNNNNGKNDNGINNNNANNNDKNSNNTPDHILEAPSSIRVPPNTALQYEWTGRALNLALEVHFQLAVCPGGVLALHYNPKRKLEEGRTPASFHPSPLDRLLREFPGQPGVARNAAEVVLRVAHHTVVWTGQRARLVPVRGPPRAVVAPRNRGGGVPREGVHNDGHGDDGGDDNGDGDDDWDDEPQPAHGDGDVGHGAQNHRRSGRPIEGEVRPVR